MDDINFAKTDMHGKRLEGSYQRCNFDGCDMSGVEAEGVNFSMSSFRGTILRDANFKDAILSGAVFEPTDAFGLTLTMRCETFQGMRTGQQWWYAWLYFATLMEPARLPVPLDLKTQLIGFIGAERYVRLRGMFTERVY